MAVKRLTRNSQFGAQLTDLGAGLAHRGLRQAQLGSGHLEWPAAITAAGARRDQACSCALDDQCPLELGQRSEDGEHKTAVGGRGVQLRALAGQDLQADTMPGQVMDEIDQVVQVAAKPVEFSGRQRVALAQRLEARLQARSAVALARRVVFVEASRLDAGGEQRVALQVQRLTAIGLRDAHVADQHWRELLHKRANT